MLNQSNYLIIIMVIFLPFSRLSSGINIPCHANVGIVNQEKSDEANVSVRLR